MSNEELSVRMLIAAYEKEQLQEEIGSGVLHADSPGRFHFSVTAPSGLMYLVVSITNPKAIDRDAVMPQPLGAGVSPAVAQQFCRREVWGSSFTHEGEDFNEFRGFDEHGQEIVHVVVEGD